MRLAVSTVTKEGSVSLSSEEKVLTRRQTDIDLITWLPETLHELLTESGQKADSIEKIIVSSGPGYFTGTRIGIAFAKGLKCGNSVIMEYADSENNFAARMPPKNNINVDTRK